MKFKKKLSLIFAVMLTVFFTLPFAASAVTFTPTNGKDENNKLVPIYFYSTSIYMMNLDNGEPLVDINSEEKLSPGYLTQLMTCALILDKFDGNEKKLKETSPYREHKEGDSSKHYRDSWKKKKNKRKTRFGLSEGTQVLSESKPHLTHLLENGHRVVLPQGREFKKADAKRFVAAKKHIQPVQEEANETFLAAVDEVLRRHGK